MKSKIMSISITAISAMVILSACSSATATPKPTATTSAAVDPSAMVVEGTVEPVRYVDIALSASGLVSEVLSKEGEGVEAGQVIARLENNQAQTLQSAQASALLRLTDAYQVLRDAQYKLDNFDAPSEYAGMTPGQAVQVSLGKLNAARDAFEPYKWMNDKQLKLTEAEQDGDVLIGNTPKRLKKQLDDAWAKYRKTVEWLDDESAVDTAKAQLAQAQKDNDGLQDASFAENTAGVRAALANAEVRAPIAGTITNLDLKVGEFASAGQPIVTIADLSSWVVKTTDLTEIDVVNITEGQPVTLTLDAVPGVTLNGKILSISQNYSKNLGNVVYEVTVALTDKNPAIRWGMTAEVNFNH